MTDESAGHCSRALPVVLAAIVAVIVATTVVLPAMGGGGEDLNRFYEASDEWCESRNGTLYTTFPASQGELYCELPNGTTVHMNEVLGPSLSSFSGGF